MRSVGLVATQTLTFLFTDIEGSTAMTGRLGDGWAGVLADQYRLIRAALAAHGGDEVACQGDGVFAALASQQACVAAAIQAQRELVAHAWPGGATVRVRMGVHSGEASRTSAGLARLEVHGVGRSERVFKLQAEGLSAVRAAAVAG